MARARTAGGVVEGSESDAARVVQELQRTGRPIEFERVETPGAMR